MSGKLLIVTGFSCSGKTTYIQACHDLFKDSIQHRTFFTNRAPRSNHELATSPDYTFISTDRYIELSCKSNWHWTTWFGFKYGFNIPLEIEQIRNGDKIIIGAFPTMHYVEDMRKIYNSSNVVSIFLNVNFDTIQNRLLQRPFHEHKRINEFNQQQINYCADNADVIFTPINNLEIDCKKFLAIAMQLLNL